MMANDGLKIIQNAYDINDYKKALIKLGSIFNYPKIRRSIKENKMLKDVIPGQWIWTIQDGWIKIVKINRDNPYPIVTETEESYTLKGLNQIGDFSASVFLFNPFDPFEKHPCEFKKGEVIAVRNYENEKWEYLQFFKTYDNCYLCINDVHYKYARKLIEKEKGV